jgi:hypothetical protein
MGISRVKGKHLESLIGGGARLIISVSEMADQRSRVQKLTDQSRLKPVIVYCESDVISEIRF